jgi:hypothetical protein
MTLRLYAVRRSIVLCMMVSQSTRESSRISILAMGFAPLLVVLAQYRMVRGQRLLLECTPNLYDLVRMLLKTGYRYVYVSRKFAMRHSFIPQDAAPGHYGYSGLVK